MMRDDNLDEFGGLWRSEADDQAARRPLADIASRRRRQRLSLLLEMAVATAGAVVGVALLLDSQYWIGAAALVYSVFGGAIGWMSRSSNIAALDMSVAEHINASVALVEARLYHNVSGVVMSLAAIAFYAFIRIARDSSFDAIDIVVPFGLLLLGSFFFVRAIRARRELVGQKMRQREFAVGEEAI